MMAEANARANGLDIAGPNFTMDMHGLDAQGKPVSLGRKGVLVLAAGRKVVANGSGFLSGSKVAVYLDPAVGAGSGQPAAVLIGTVKVKANGTFTLTGVLPKATSAGVHDLQTVGVTKGNLLRAVTLGVSVTNRPI
jgi:hypothetical protein